MNFILQNCNFSNISVQLSVDSWHLWSALFLTDTWLVWYYARRSLHQTQEQTTLYPEVILRGVDSVIPEDCITFITSNLKHNVPCVEFCNKHLLHEYYKLEGLKIAHYIEYDGCSSQFKCIKAFSSLVRRSIKTTHIFCDKSYRKSKSDGLGGVIESYVYHGVFGGEIVARNAK